MVRHSRRQRLRWFSSKRLRAKSSFATTSFDRDESSKFRQLYTNTGVGLKAWQSWTCGWQTRAESTAGGDQDASATAWEHPWCGRTKPSKRVLSKLTRREAAESMAVLRWLPLSCFLIACWTAVTAQSFPYAGAPKYSRPSRPTLFCGWPLEGPWFQPFGSGFLVPSRRHFRGTLTRTWKWRNRSVDDRMGHLLRCWRTLRTKTEFRNSAPVQAWRVELLTEFVAMIWRLGLESSRSFWTILRNDSTKRLSVWAWQAISSKSIASIAISTSLKSIVNIGAVTDFSWLLTCIAFDWCHRLPSDTSIHRYGQVFPVNSMSRRSASPCSISPNLPLKM